MRSSASLAGRQWASSSARLNIRRGAWATAGAGRQQPGGQRRAAGYASPALGRLFDGPQRAWSFAPQLSLPLFDAGRLRAELRLAELRPSSAVVDYERAIQVAFREVADGLAGRESFARQLEAQARVVASAERRAVLSGLRYRAGTEGRVELLDAQRQLYAARQAELDLRRSALANAVALYKALGGGMGDDDAPR